MQNCLLNFIVVNIGKSIGFFPAHFLHLRPIEKFIWPPHGFGIRVAVLWSFPPIGRPNESRQIRACFSRFHRTQGLR